MELTLYVAILMCSARPTSIIRYSKPCQSVTESDDVGDRQVERSRQNLLRGNSLGSMRPAPLGGSANAADGAGFNFASLSARGFYFLPGSDILRGDISCRSLSGKRSALWSAAAAAWRAPGVRDRAFRRWNGKVSV